MKEEDQKISLFNRQRSVPVDTPCLKDFLEELANRLAPSSSFSVVLISDRKMRDYNRQYAGKDRPTDVLSFPTGEEQFGEEEEGQYLGDILISVESAERQRSDSLEQELMVLSLHGLLHLLGYDHETDQGEMRSLERKLRLELNLKSI